VADAISRARHNDRPTMIACKTTIGFGSPKKAGTAGAHGAPLGADEIAATREALGWPHAPFEIPDAIVSAWRDAGAKHREVRTAWEASESGQRVSAAVEAAASAPDAATMEAFNSIITDFAADAPKLATRQSSQKVLERIVQAAPHLIGGSADLTGSNGTKTSHHAPVSASDFGANYIHYGVREHGMAAAMNGLALHGGIVPYGATFLVFTDYCRPSIRLSALMGQRVIYVMTHDSIGLGEDGPTHQPVEHLAALRAIPGLRVYRPADAVEVAECWQAALMGERQPSVIALTRQGLPTLRTKETVDENLSRHGGYVLREADGARDVTLIATGSEIEIAVAAADRLSDQGVQAAVVSMPCIEHFRKRPAEEREAVLGSAPRVALEAGVAQGWHEWIGADGLFVGVETFGASAPYQELYDHFGLTGPKVAAAVQAHLAKA